MPKNHTVKHGFFKGPQIQLHSNANIARYGADRYPFQFGLDKARAILDCLPEIQAFVAQHGGGSSAGNIDPMGVDRAYEDDCARRAGVA